MEDLIQAGWVGWTEAWRNYDPHRGTPFRKFAYPYIKGRVIKAMAAELGLSDQGRRIFPYVTEALDSLESRGVRSPSPKQIIQEIQKNHPQVKVTTAVIEEVLRAISEPIPIGPDGSSEVEGHNGISEEKLSSSEIEEEEEGHEIEGKIEEICRALGPDAAWKFIVLGILHREGLGWTWDQICEALSNPNPDPVWREEWRRICSNYPSFLRCLPGLDNWDVVTARFQQSPPTLNPEALRQWFHHKRLRYIARSTT